MSRLVLTAVVAAMLTGCGSGGGPTVLDGSPNVAAGQKCDGGAAIAGVPATVSWHEQVSAVLLICAYSSGFGPKTWQRTTSADWYLSNSGDVAGAQLVNQNAQYSFAIPMSGNSLPGKYVLVAQAVPYTYAYPPLQAAVAFTVTPSNDPSEVYPGSPQVRALAAAIAGGFAGVQGAKIQSDAGATVYASRVQLPDMQCTIVRPAAAGPYASCVADDTAEDSPERFKDDVLLALPKLSASNPSNAASNWYLTDATTAILIEQTRPSGRYGVRITFSLPKAAP